MAFALRAELTELADIETCFEVSPDMILRALAPSPAEDGLSPREKVFFLLERMASVARPRRGAGKVFEVLACLADADWIDGELDVRVRGDAERCRVDLLVDARLGLERLRAPLYFAVPIEELRRAAAHLSRATGALVFEDLGPSDFRAHKTARGSSDSVPSIPPPAESTRRQKTIPGVAPQAITPPGGISPRRRAGT
jgi:hypothetical protein